MTGSATLPVPPGTDMRHVLIDERFDSKPWFDLQALKKETKYAHKALKAALQEAKR